MIGIIILWECVCTQNHIKHLAGGGDSSCNCWTHFVVCWSIFFFLSDRLHRHIVFEASDGCDAKLLSLALVLTLTVLACLVPKARSQASLSDLGQSKAHNDCLEKSYNFFRETVTSKLQISPKTKSIKQLHIKDQFCLKQNV